MGKLDFSKMNKRYAGGGGGGRDTENIAVEFKSVDVANPKGATPAEDVLVAYLLHDALGLRAEFDADNNPTTEVRIKINPKRSSRLTGEFAPLEIYDLPKKKGNHKPVHPGGVIVLENSYLEERSGMIVANWLSVASRNPAEAVETAHTGLLVSVETERYTDVKENGQEQRKFRQYRYVAIADSAMTFNSLEQFKANAAELLMEEPAKGGGRPGIWVRLLDMSDPNNLATTQITLTWDRDNDRMRTPEEVIDAWLADPDNAEFVGNIEIAGTPDGEGYLFEQIPFSRYNTGSMSLPSKSTKGRDDSVNFKIPVLDDKGQPAQRRDGTPAMTNGYTKGTMVIRRQEDNETAGWYATRTYAQNRFGPIYSRNEMVTPNLPADIVAVFEDRAAARGEDARKRSKEQAPAAQAEQGAAAGADYEGDVGFGEPDHRGGLTPR